MSNGVKAWSWSAYSDYNRCPLYYVENYIHKAIPKVTSPAMERGNVLHKGAADFLLGKHAGVPKELLKHERVETILYELSQIPDKQVEQQWGFTDTWKPTAWFSKDPARATWLRVVLDVAVIYPDLVSEAIDWKTGKRYGHNDEQMELFAVAVMCQFVPVKHVTTRLVYVDTGEEEFAEFPAHHKQRLIDKWVKKVQPMFNDTVFAPRPNEKCRYCPLAKSSGGKCAFG